MFTMVDSINLLRGLQRQAIDIERRIDGLALPSG